MLFQERNQLQATSTKSNMIFLSLLYYLVRNNSMPIARGWSSKKSQATLVPLWVCAFIMLSLHLHVHEYRCVTFTCHSPCVDISREPRFQGSPPAWFRPGSVHCSPLHKLHWVPHSGFPTRFQRFSFCIIDVQCCSWC